MNAPDREIYLRYISLQALTQWLEAELGPLRTEEQEGKQTHLLAQFRGEDIPVFILEDTPAKPYSCLWIQSDNVPWSNDLELARAATQALDCETRCTANAWKEGDDEENDEWIVVTKEEEKKIIWRG